MLQGFRKGSLKFCKGCEGFCTGSRQVSERRGLCSQLQKAKGDALGLDLNSRALGFGPRTRIAKNWTTCHIQERW